MNNFNVDSIALMNALMPDKFAVGNGAVIVKCVHCGKDMMPRGKLYNIYCGKYNDFEQYS